VAHSRDAPHSTRSPLPLQVAAHAMVESVVPFRLVVAQQTSPRPQSDA
jgi:hypothetical protein